MRTPGAPDYYFGNLLVLDRAPQNGELEKLESDFAKFIGAPPRIKHRAFQWAVVGDEPPALDSFIQAGYEFSETAVLIATPKASWHGPGFHGRKSASGERFNMHSMTAAHPSLPLQSWVLVRNGTAQIELRKLSPSEASGAAQSPVK